MNKLLIKDKDIGIIKDLAARAFRDRPTFNGLDNKEIQIYSILSGFLHYLNGKGIEIPVELQGFIQEDCEPIDISGD